MRLVGASSRALVLFVALAAASVTGAAAPAGAAAEFDGTVTVTDSGFWHESVAYGPHTQWSTSTLSYSWHGSETFDVYDLHSGVPEFRPLTAGPAAGPEATGEIQYAGSTTNPSARPAAARSRSNPSRPTSAGSGRGSWKGTST